MLRRKGVLYRQEGIPLEKKKNLSKKKKERDILAAGDAPFPQALPRWEGKKESVLASHRWSWAERKAHPSHGRKKRKGTLPRPPESSFPEKACFLFRAEDLLFLVL